MGRPSYHSHSGTLSLRNTVPTPSPYTPYRGLQYYHSAGSAAPPLTVTIRQHSVETVQKTLKIFLRDASRCAGHVCITPVCVWMCCPCACVRPLTRLWSHGGVIRAIQSFRASPGVPVMLLPLLAFAPRTRNGKFGLFFFARRCGCHHRAAPPTGPVLAQSSYFSIRASISSYQLPPPTMSSTLRGVRYFSIIVNFLCLSSVGLDNNLYNNYLLYEFVGDML